MRYLFVARWPEGFVCPACGTGKAWPLQTKAWTWECAYCGKQTSVTAGTIMHHSKLPLTLWFWAAYLMATHSNGISALQLQRQLGLGSYKSAWLLCAKLRRSMVASERSPLAGLVEVEERAALDDVAGPPAVRTATPSGIAMARKCRPSPPTRDDVIVPVLPTKSMTRSSHASADERHDSMIHADEFAPDRHNGGWTALMINKRSSCACGKTRDYSCFRADQPLEQSRASGFVIANLD